MSGWKAGQPIKGYENLNSLVLVSRKMIVPSDEMLANSLNLISKEGKTQLLWLTECYLKFAIEGKFD
jgi:hypothetical protein